MTRTTTATLLALPLAPLLLVALTAACSSSTTPSRANDDAGAPEAASDASTLPTDAASDGGEGGPDPACVDYCTCMPSACSSVANYPFGDIAVCYSACAVFSAAERACFTSFCRKAGEGVAKEHNCDHATGKLGLAECP